MYLHLLWQLFIRSWCLWGVWNKGVHNYVQTWSYRKDDNITCKTSFLRHYECSDLNSIWPHWWESCSFLTTSDCHVLRGIHIDTAYAQSILPLQTSGSKFCRQKSRNITWVIFGRCLLSKLRVRPHQISAFFQLQVLQFTSVQVECREPKAKTTASLGISFRMCPADMHKICTLI